MDRSGDFSDPAPSYKTDRMKRKGTSTMKLNKAASTLAFMLALVLPTIAVAQMPPPMPRGGIGGPPAPPLVPPFMLALRSANLTSEQQTKLREILDSSRPESESMLKELHSIHQQIADKLLSSGTVTESDLAPLTRRAGQLEEKMQQQSIATALKIRAILTPEQLAKMSTFNQRMSSIHSQIEALMGGKMAPPEPAAGERQ